MNDNRSVSKLSSTPPRKVEEIVEPQIQAIISEMYGIFMRYFSSPKEKIEV